LGQNTKGMLIYGLNSAGKSVLMKAIGINIIMAQAGFFVPARSFIYYPYKSLYTRITGNDNLFRGLSSFSLEIVELNSILKRSTSSTLVIGDEVCRGTEHISGNAIVAATLIRLSEIKSSFVFATHLHELIDLDEIKEIENIKAYHLSVEHDEKTDKLIYDRILKEGSGERIYGITVTKHIIKDMKFIETAINIKNKLMNKPKTIITSKYNTSVILDKCEICGKEIKKIEGISNLEAHHINHQSECTNGFVNTKQHIKKNHISNIAVLCRTCHDNQHTKNDRVISRKMTSKGNEI
jgi:DNA mismatch repair protein MutS